MEEDEDEDEDVEVAGRVLLGSCAWLRSAWLPSKVCALSEPDALSLVSSAPLLSSEESLHKVGCFPGAG